MISTPADIKVLQNKKTLFPHHILLAPVPCPSSLLDKYYSPLPTLVFVHDHLRAQASEVINALGNAVSVTSIDSLTQEGVLRHWAQIITAFEHQGTTVLPSQHILKPKPASVTWIPTLSMMQSLGLPPTLDESVSHLASPDAGATYSTDVQARISALFRLNHLEGKPTAWSAIPQQEVNKERVTFQCPIALGLPGISPYSSSRRLAKIAKDLKFENESDAHTENSALGFIVAHRAMSRGGIGILAEKISDEAFVRLRNLESHWASGKPKPSYVWRALRNLGAQISRTLSSSQLDAIKHASYLECFSEFPIGLAILPGDSAPLSCHFPISYRPICPLSGTLAREISGTPVTLPKNSLKVLIVECIPLNDPIGKISRDIWTHIKDSLTSKSNILVTIAECHDAADIKSSVESDNFDILVISAHGGLARERNAAGFQCGNRMVVDDDLGKLPPIVMLSACQVTPRGYGTVNVGDLFFRRGATVVLAPLVPIDVMHNASLMERLFKIIAAEVCSATKKFNSFEDIWHFTATSNAVYDVLAVNAKARSWALEVSNGLSVIDEFMHEVAFRPLRMKYVYDDTISTFRLIAAKRGVRVKFDSWVSQGFVPETIFYALLGWPDRIALR